MKKTMLLIFSACLTLGLAATASAQTYSTNAFSVEVPQDAMDLADIEAGDNTLSFFESQAHQGGAGHVGTIMLFDKEEEYAYMPHFQWAGVIVTKEGAEKQVVINYPSDVQADISSEEAMERYQTLAELFREKVLPSLTTSDGEYFTPDQVDHKSLYGETLARLKELIGQKASREELQEESFTYLYSYLYEDEEALGQLQVAYVDMDQTGFPEMAIMAEDGSVIYDCFAQKDGEVIHVFSGGERDRFSFVGHEEVPSFILEVASGGAFYTEFRTYSIDQIQKELYPQTKFIYDEKAENGPYLVQYFDEEPEPLSEEDWNQRMGNFGETIIVPATPLFDQ